MLFRSGRWIEWPTLVVLPVLWLTLATIRAADRERVLVERRLEDVMEALAAVGARTPGRLAP